MKLVRVFLLLALAACSSGGDNTPVASEGVTLRMSVFAPSALAEGAEGTIDVIVSDRGAGPVSNVLVDVGLPPQLTLVNESHGTGVSLIRDPKLLRYTIGGLGVGSDSRIRVTVRAQFGGAAETGAIRVVAQEPAVGGDRLERTTTIKLAK
jgi:hypothetical protein